MTARVGPADLRRLARTALPVLAILVPIVTIGAVLSVAGKTLGYDYLMYDGAAHRLMAGGPLYDVSFSAPGPNGLFDYPPTFILAVLPFAAALSPHAASLVWIAMLNVAFVVGVAILPVRRETRWALLLLAGLSWPYIYAVKLGQLGPLLFLLYAIAWRWADRPAGAGVSAALGTAAKLQPLLLFGWALATRRFRAVALGLGVLLAGALVATVLAGPRAWPDWIGLISRVGNNALTAPQVLSIGAVAYRAGLPLSIASLVQWTAAAAAGAVALIAWVRYPASVAIVVTAVASVLVSPIVWPHYAVIILLPVALLLERRQWWAVALPIVTWLPVDAIYPVVFVIGLLAPLAVGEQLRRSEDAARERPLNQGPRPPVLSSRS